MGFAITSLRIVLFALISSLLFGCFAPSPAYGPLHEAARKGDTAFARSWVNEGRPVDEQYNDTGSSLEANYAKIRGLTPLMVAARSGHLDTVRILVDGGANIYAESRWADGSNPTNPFDYAVDGGHRAVAAYLWEKSDKKRFARKLDLQLFAACFRYCEEKYGSDEKSNLALFIAGITTDREVLGRGIGSVACWRNSLSKLEFLARHGVEFPKNTLHCVASYEGSHNHLMDAQSRIDVAQFLLNHGADPNYLPKGSFHTPLMGAAGAHELELVRFLLAHGADPNRANEQNYTPLITAANNCSYALPSSSPSDIERLEAQQRVQLAVIESLVGAGAYVPTRLTIEPFSQCCTREPKTVSQKRICQIFGRNG